MTDRTPVLSPTRAAFLVIEGFWIWYRRNWRSTATTTVVQPVLFLVALGFGFGSLVEVGAATRGLPYDVYLAPALLVATAMQTAAFESTYPVLSLFKWQRQYHAIAASPITPGQIAGGQLVWIALRMAGSGVIYLAVAAALGAVAGPAVLLSLPVAVLTGMALSAPIAAYAATRDTEASFASVFRFVVLPMTLFAGTFFSVDTLPAWVRPLAWLTPLWHGTELSRVSFGGLEFWPAVGHLAYLLGLFAIGAALTVRYFYRRLAG